MESHIPGVPYTWSPIYLESHIHGVPYTWRGNCCLTSYNSDPNVGLRCNVMASNQYLVFMLVNISKRHNSRFKFEIVFNCITMIIYVVEYASIIVHLSCSCSNVQQNCV